MEQYKQALCHEFFGKNCNSENDILDIIKDNPRYTYHLNEEGNLHSKYSEENGCYEPAIIFTRNLTRQSFWLFSGEIKDCLHPFEITADHIGRDIWAIKYYSSERITQEQPIHLYYMDHRTSATYYNRHANHQILDDIKSYISNIALPQNNLDMSQFVTLTCIICPLWPNEFVSGFKFKFED